MASLKTPPLNLLQMSLRRVFLVRPISFHLKPASKLINCTTNTLKIPISQFFSTTATPFPLQYEMIISHPHQTTPSRRKSLSRSKPQNSDDPGGESNYDLGLDNWVDRKLASNQINNLKSDVNADSDDDGGGEIMDKSKRKYYNKRRKRMYGGTDSDDENHHRRDSDEGFVELKPEVVEFDRLHQREEELYFYDTFAFPWEKDKHYKMVYQLEKKYYPDHSFDKAFLEPGETNAQASDKSLMGKVKSKKSKKNKAIGDSSEKGLMFFDNEKNDNESVMGIMKDEKKDISEKKVEDFFKCLNKVPDKETETGNVEPYLVTRHHELPPRWDGPNGTVVLVNKPKGWTSFTVCGKLRRLVQVKKVSSFIMKTRCTVCVLYMRPFFTLLLWQQVGHAGTLDPMATGLLIVCVGKATKLVDRYQGMIKGYSGVFRLGEATSTWDADSPVIQREPWEHIKDDDIKKAVGSFCGEIWQVPPMFSAIKVGGERMYDKARRGESMELSPRRISVFQFDIERSLDDRQNLIFKVICSKGTYIRSLCADLGKALGSCAHLTALRRDSIGEYSADDAWDFKELEEAVTKIYL